MSSATEEPRRLLNELRKLACDINEKEIRSHSVITLNQGRYNRQFRLDMNHDWLNAWHAELERILQAIEATLGREDTYTREDVEGAFVSGYSLGLDMFDSSKQEKGWNQNERNLDEEMEDLGWVRKDTAKLDTGTCRNAAPSYLDFLCSECGFVYYRNDENFCGDNDWNFCPNCGRKVVKE